MFLTNTSFEIMIFSVSSSEFKAPENSILKSINSYIVLIVSHALYWQLENQECTRVTHYTSGINWQVYVNINWRSISSTSDGK